MDKKLQFTNKSKSLTPSTFFQQFSAEENKSLNENRDIQSNRSGQRQQFEIQNSKPEKLHEGDIQISYQQIQGDLNDSFQNSLKEVDNNQVLNLSQQPFNQPISNQSYRLEEQTNCLFQSKQSQLKVDQNQLIQWSNQEDKPFYFQKNVKQASRKNIETIQSSQNFEQNKQIQLSLKNSMVKSENKKFSSKKQLKSDDKVRFSHIQIQDEMIYEKDLKKIGTRVNTILKSQYLSQHDLNSQQNFKQNFQKANNIISRLLNSSMNRILRIKQNVKDFVQNLKIRRSNIRLCDLSEKEFEVVNDLSHFFNQKIQRHQRLQIFIIFSRIFKLSSQLAVFMPTNMFRVIWDLVQVAFTYIFFYFYSILIFFDQSDLGTRLIQEVSSYAFIIFFLDILVSLNTSFFDKDVIIKQRKLIAKQYFLSSIFITDLVSMFALGSKVFYPNTFAINNLNQNIFVFGLNILIFLKVNGISHKKKRFDYIFTLTENQKHISKLFNQIASVITVAHIAAIGLYLVGVQESNYNHINWLDKINIQSYTYYQKYTYSIYWSITTMTTEQKDRDKQQEDKILSVLSNKLRDEITQEINSKILNNCLIFSSNFSQSTLNKIIFIMEEILVYPNQVIINEDQCDDSSIYFIQNGQIEIYQQKDQKQNVISVIKILNSGEVFGELSFFSGLQRQASARSVNLSTLYKISREEFIKVLKENNEDFESFKMMQDQIIFQKDISISHSLCYYCNSKNHIVKECPRTHKYFDKQFIILKQNFSVFQDRTYKERNYFKNKKSKINRYKHNLEEIQQLIQNVLKSNEGNCLEFIKYDNIMTDSSQSQNAKDNNSYEDEEEEEEGESSMQVPIKIEEKVNENNLKNSKKNQQNERIEKQVKSINNLNSILINNEDPEQLTNLENQIQSFHSNLIYENQEFAKATSNITNSQAKMKSFETTDCMDQNNLQESQSLNPQKSGYYTESNKVFYKKETKPEFQCQTQNQDDQGEDEQYLQNSKKLDFQKSLQKNTQLTEYLKSQIKQGPCYNNLNKQNCKSVSSQSIDDNSLTQAQDNQIQKSINIQNNKSKQKLNRLSIVKKESSKLNQLTNQNQNELRSSVEQMILQNIISLSLMQDQKSQQLSIRENTENTSSQKFNNKINTRTKGKDSSQNKNQLQQQQSERQKQNSNENLQFFERFSKMVQESQLPLLLQLTAGKSFIQDSQFMAQNSMDYFDKMQQFRKFYPKNNFDKILNKLKIAQQQQKKQKKIKLASRERRQNIAYFNQMTLSILQENNNFIRLFEQDYDLNSYKPTNLSYGTKMLQGVKYPIFNTSKSRC
ncbi:hypothetical protein ABPG73_018935 [Tetrahymena malaccensis]